MSKISVPKIILSGGGTLGPVTPLLAIYEIYKKANPEAEFIWVGTKSGPERKLVEEYGLPFFAISSGKWRRYFSLQNLFDLFKIKLAFFQSLIFLLKTKPDLIISAGGFVSVPLHWAGFFLGIKSWIHQQDVHVGMSTWLMAGLAKKVTTATKKSLEDLPTKKTEWIGNPVRQDILEGSKEEAQKLFNLDQNLPVILATGGGTGSLKINQIIVEAVGHLHAQFSIIHLTGIERSPDLAIGANRIFNKNYKIVPFLGKEMKHAYAVADIVVSRGGFGTISELAALKKPAILIPKPGQQDDNVEYFQKQNAVLSLNEEMDNGLKLANEIKDLFREKTSLKFLGERLHEVLPLAKSEDVVRIIDELI